jgi:hypothetical protein
VVGIIKTAYTDSFSIALLWNILNTLIFGYFTRAALQEARHLRHERRRERKQIKVQQEGGVA